MTKQKLLRTIPLLMMSGIIFSFSLQVADVSNQQSGFIVTILIPLLSPIFPNLSVHTLTYLVRKTAHFSEYALLGLFGRNAKIAWEKKQGANLFWLYGTLIAICDETIQYFTPGRSCQLSDMLLDSAGYLFGYALLTLLLHLHAQYHQSKSAK